VGLAASSIKTRIVCEKPSCQNLSREKRGILSGLARVVAIQTHRIVSLKKPHGVREPFAL
jgi:hypothetical protein